LYNSKILNNYFDNNKKGGKMEEIILKILQKKL